MNDDLSANSLALSALAVLAAYLVGSIPFGYLVTYWVKGIDIRTVGSGNLGATNVGRTLGFRYFLLVFLLDMLKGFLPTLGFPWSGEPASPARAARLAGARGAGGDPGSYVSGLSQVSGRQGSRDQRGHRAGTRSRSRAPCRSWPLECLLGVTRYVSLASLGGGLAFVAAHFAREPSPLSREHIAMSLFSIAVLALLVRPPSRQPRPDLGGHRAQGQLSSGADREPGAGQAPSERQGRRCWSLSCWRSWSAVVACRRHSRFTGRRTSRSR